MRLAAHHQHKSKALVQSGFQQALSIGSKQLVSESTFKVVGVVLGLNEVEATTRHVQRWLATALIKAQRLRGLPLPAALCSFCGAPRSCRRRCAGARSATSHCAAGPLGHSGKVLLANKLPLSLNTWCSPAVLTGLLLGDMALREPTLAMRERQLRWLYLICNSRGFARTVHRAAVGDSDPCLEPLQSLLATWISYAMLG